MDQDIPQNESTEDDHGSWCMNNVHKTMNKTAEVEPSKADISASSANIGPVAAKSPTEKEVRVADETRPKNMRAVFIMRIE